MTQLVQKSDSLPGAAATFRFSSDILRRLGEELNPHADQGILELVKNAYDADARRCTVELRGIDKPGGTIIITDDGVGMDGETIKSYWVVRVNLYNNVPF